MDPERLRHIVSLFSVLINQVVYCCNLHLSIARGENSDRALAQQVVAVQETVTALEDLYRDIVRPKDDLNATMSILIQHTELTPIQRIRIADYLVVPEHKNQAIAFRAFNEDDRKWWLASRLAEIAGDKPDV